MADEKYDDTDADVTNDTPTDSGTFEAGPIRYDPATDGLVAGPIIGGSQSVSSFAEDPTVADLQAVGNSVASLGVTAFFYYGDPLGLLVYAGLNFLIDVIQPLDDALGLVTGNPEKMTEVISQWERISTALTPLAQDVRTAAENDLIGWEGKGAEAAKERLGEFADGIDGMSTSAAQLVYLFKIARDLMESAQYLIQSIIANFIQWLLITWIPALAAAGPTFGGSTAAAAAVTSVRLAMTTLKVSQKLMKVAKLLLKLAGFLLKFQAKQKAAVRAFYRIPTGRHAKPSTINPFRAQWNMLSNKNTYIPVVTNIMDAGVTTFDHIRDPDNMVKPDLSGLNPDETSNPGPSNDDPPGRIPPDRPREPFDPNPDDFHVPQPDPIPDQPYDPLPGDYVTPDPDQPYDPLPGDYVTPDDVNGWVPDRAAQQTRNPDN